MRTTAGAYRRLYAGGAILLGLALLALVAAFLLVRALGLGATLILAGAVGVYAWALRFARTPNVPAKRGRADEAWEVAAAATYGLPTSPAFRSVEGHRHAVRRICGLRPLDAAGIARTTGFPLAFVESVLRNLPNDLGEGGAGVGARLIPRGPGPIAAAE